MNLWSASIKLDIKHLKMIGWPGVYVESQQDRLALVKLLENVYNMHPLFFPDHQIENVVENCYAAILNPLLMNFFKSHDTDIEIDSKWNDLKNFSETFALEVAKLITNQNTYLLFLEAYLLLVPFYMRKLYTPKKMNCMLGMYFNNTFSSYSVFKMFPFAEDIIDSLVSLDVLVFQSFEHMDGFVQSIRWSKRVNYKIERGVMYVCVNNKTTILRIGGILAYNPLVQQEIYDKPSFPKTFDLLKDKYNGKYLIVSFDPFSSYGGIEIKLKSLKEFVLKHCANGRPIHFVQIMNDVVPWVAYSKSALESIERYTQLFSEDDLPLFQSELVLTSKVSDEVVYGYLKLANMLLNTRLSSSSDPVMVNYFKFNANGYALMSHFTAFDNYASTMIKVNPYSKTALFKGLLRILKISGYFSGKDLFNELIKNPKVVERIETHKWLKSLLADMKLSRSLKGDGHEFFEKKREEKIGQTVFKLDTNKLKTSFKTAKKILILCGFEGTLTTEKDGELIVTNEGKTIRMPPKMNKDFLKTLDFISKDQRVNLYVLTARNVDDAKDILGEKSSIGVGAEKGYYYKMAGVGSSWESICDFNESWKTVAMNIMKQFESKIPGSLTEYSNTGVMWTFDVNADEITYKKAQTLKKNLQKTLMNYASIDVSSGDGFVEVKHHVISKAGFAELLIRYLQQDNQKIDLIVAVGTSESNDDLFASLNHMKTNSKILSSVIHLII